MKKRIALVSTLILTGTLFGIPAMAEENLNVESLTIGMTKDQRVV